MALRVLSDVFSVTRRAGCVTEAVVANGGYFDASPYVTSEHFPIRCGKPDARLIKLIESDSHVYHLDVLGFAGGFGLLRPEHEDALFFGEKKQFPKELEKKLFAFFHEPWRGLCIGAYASHIVICLCGRQGNGGVVERKLALDWERRKWPPGTIFPFIFERRDSRNDFAGR